MDPVTLGMAKADAARKYQETAYGLPKVIGWYDASTLSGANGSGIQTWRDSSSYSQDLIQATAGNQPTLVTAGQNGRNVARFGATGYMNALGFGNATWPQPIAWTKPNTIIMVVKVSSALNLVQRVLIGGGASTGRNNILLASDANRVTLYAGTGGSGAQGGPPMNDDAWHIIVGVFDTGSSSVYIDGYLTSLQLGTPGTEDLSSLTLGAANGGGSPSNMDVAEVIICNDRLSPAAALDVTKKLRAKWATPVVPPAAQDSVPYVDTTSSNGQAVRYWVPKTLPAGGAPLVIYNHPSSGTAAVAPNYFAYVTLRALVNEGYIVVASNMHGENWGNDAGVADILDAYNYINTNIKTVSKVVLWGNSMGGLATARAVKNATVPNLKGALVIDGVLSLASMYSNVTYTALIDGAYAITAGTLAAAPSAGATTVSSSVSFPAGTSIRIDATGANPETVTTTGAPTGAGPYTIPVPALAFAHASGARISDYPTKTAGFDPMLNTAASYGSLRWRFHASSADTVVPKTTNADAFAAKVAPLATESTVVPHYIGHLTQLQQMPGDAIAFVRRCFA